MNGFFSVENHIATPGVVLTASASSPAAAPLSNLALPSPEDSARINTTAGYVRADFGAAKAIGLIVMRGNPLLSYFGGSDTVDFKLGTTAGGTDVLNVSGRAHGVESVTVNGVRYHYGYSAYVPTSVLSARYAQFGWSAPSLTSVTDLGLWWVGDRRVPTRNLKFGETSGFDDFGKTERSDKTGRRVSNRGGKKRRLTFGYDTFSDADRRWVDDLMLSVGTTGQLAFVRAPDSDTLGYEVIIGQIAEPTRTERASFRFSTAAFTLIED